MRFVFILMLYQLVSKSKFDLVLYLLSLCSLLFNSCLSSINQCHLVSLLWPCFSFLFHKEIPCFSLAHCACAYRHLGYAFCGSLHLNLYAPLVDTSLTLRSYPSLFLSLIVHALTGANLIGVVDTLPTPCQHFPLYIRTERSVHPLAWDSHDSNISSVF